MEVVPEPRLVAAPIGGATTKAAKRVPSVVARKLRAFEASDATFDDAVDAALSVDGSVAPSDCGSDATSAFAGSDGFENIAASRAAAARAERAVAEGDVPWVRYWDARAAAYDALLDAQPVLRRRITRVAQAALDAAGVDKTARTSDRPVVAVDLAAGGGACGWALAALVNARGHRIQLEVVEPAHAMAARARARAAALDGARAIATIWQIPVERCAERLPARCLGAADVCVCSAALDAVNEHDIFEAAAALLKPGGALAVDLSAAAYDGFRGDVAAEHAACERAVNAAVAAAGGGDGECDVAAAMSRPPTRAPRSAPSLAAAAAAAGLRLARCDVESDTVAADLFVARYAVDGDRSHAVVTHGDADWRQRARRASVLLDAARRAAATPAMLRTAVVVVAKPDHRRALPHASAARDTCTSAGPRANIRDDHFLSK